jgi:hypothetical protein
MLLHPTLRGDLRVTSAWGLVCAVLALIIARGGYKRKSLTKWGEPLRA